MADHGVKLCAAGRMAAVLIAVAGCACPEPAVRDLVEGAAGTVDRLQSVHYELQIEGRPT